MTHPSVSTSPAIRVRDLTLAYHGRAVLADVNLEIRSGEFWFLIGRNGSGKTTLLRAILGLLAPASGTVERSSRAKGREGLGYVPQRCDLNPSLATTVREFVSLGLVGGRIARAERDEALAWALGRVGLAGLEGTDYWSLSGGQRQRALVARALVRRPDLLILDEPTEGLDVATEDGLLTTLEDLNREAGTTLVFVTHKLSTTVRFASHVAIVHDGRVSSGASAEVLRPDRIERVFGMTVERILSGEESASAPERAR